MSHTPLGPGWWQASDGRWYPPLHPALQSLRPQAAVPEQPEEPPPARARRRVRSALAVVLVLLVVGAGVIGIGNALLGRVGNALASETGCAFIGEERASAVLGGQFEFVQLGGITDLVKVAADIRPLPDGNVCLGRGSDASGERIVTIARLDTADAAARFERVRTEASSVELFRKDVPLGDQAFCTTADLISSSGVFVRRGNALLYVSMTAPDKAETDDANCALAQKLAAEVR